MSRHTLKSHVAHRRWPVLLCSASIKPSLGPTSELLHRAGTWAAPSGLKTTRTQRHDTSLKLWAGFCALLSLGDGQREREECRNVINGHKYQDRRGTEEMNELIVGVCPPFLGSSVYTKSVFNLHSPFWCSNSGGLLGLRLNSVSWKHKNRFISTWMQICGL